jgi:hypothetical protein
MLVSFTFTIGFFTRTSAALTFITFLALHHRNPVILNGGDSFCRIAIFFMIFAPAGAMYSVDRWMRVRSGKEKGEPALREPWAQRLIQLQLAFVYLYTFAWKAAGPMWLDGTAVYYTSRLVEFWRFPVPYVFEHMWTIKLWTWGTLAVELSLALLVWIKELRYPVLLLGVLLHLGIEYSMNIPLFGFIMIFAYMTYVDGTDLERVLHRFKVFRKPVLSPAPVRRPAVGADVASATK